MILFDKKQTIFESGIRKLAHNSFYFCFKVTSFEKFLSEKYLHDEQQRITDSGQFKCLI